MGRTIMNEMLLKKRFQKSIVSYNENAFIQKSMAETLVNILPGKDYDAILEIGCGSGFLTQQCSQKLNYQKYTANDIVNECYSMITKYDKNIQFLSGNIENIKLENKIYNLIISNAVFQWFKNPYKTIEQLKTHLTPGGTFAFSSFGHRNFYEIKELLGIGLDYFEYSNKVKEDIVEIEFTSIIELLKHIKQTGVNAITNYTFTKGRLQEFERKYIERFGKIKLTYNPVYVIVNYPEH